MPSGWEASDFFGRTFEPPDAGPSGLAVWLSFDNGCNGECTAQDWSANANGEDGILTRPRARGDVDLDVALEDGWLLRTSDGPRLDVLVVRWDDESRFYFECNGRVGDGDVELYDDLTELCLDARPHWLG